MASPTAPASPDIKLLPMKSPNTLDFAIHTDESVRASEVARYMGRRPYLMVSGMRMTPPTANAAVFVAYELLKFA